MKNIVLIVTLLLSSFANADFAYTEYKPGTIRSAISALDIETELDYLFEMGTYKYLISAKYTGNNRKITEPVKNYIVKWARATGKPKETENLFRYEVEIEQERNLYWLPLQEQLFEPFIKEVEAGGSVSLYIMTLGALKQNPILGINEFSAN
jgi:hypothetical protein